MATVVAAGFVRTGAGVAVNGATVDAYVRNTSSVSQGNTTTNASGYWTLSIATQDRYDYKIVNGTSTIWLSFDDQIQVQRIETAELLIMNPANTFKYNIVPAAITADRTLNLPLITGTDTVVSLALAQTLTNKTLTAPTITATDWANANHAHAAANSGGILTTGVVTREGFNTTQTSTTSTTAVDLITITGLNIALARLKLITVQGFKNLSANFSGALGLKINATNVLTPVAGTTGILIFSATANENEGGAADTWLGPGIAGVSVPIRSEYQSYNNGTTRRGGGVFASNLTNTVPTVAITDVIITALTGDASNSVLSQAVHVYSFQDT